MLENITSWIQANPDMAILVVPAFAFLEACVGIGLFISGVILLTLSTFLYKQGIAPISQIVPLAFVGALLGDHVGYCFGKWIGPSFHQSSFAQKRQSVIQKSENLINAKGGYAILIGRLIPAIRSLVPMMTGIVEFSHKRYTMFALLACAIWASLLGVLVYGIDKLI